MALIEQEVLEQKMIQNSLKKYFENDRTINRNSLVFAIVMTAGMVGYCFGLPAYYVLKNKNNIEKQKNIVQENISKTNSVIKYQSEIQR